jgi:hypothetical protein
VSSTVTDLESEDWAGGWDDTVDKCRARVSRANGFILVLGFRYESVPPGENKALGYPTVPQRFMDVSLNAN